MRIDENLIEITGKRKIRVGTGGEMTVSVPGEVTPNFGWTPGMVLRPFLDIEKRELIYRLIPDESAAATSETPAAPEAAS